jgi:hypothetical protein
MFFDNQENSKESRVIDSYLALMDVIHVLLSQYRLLYNPAFEHNFPEY